MNSFLADSKTMKTYHIHIAGQVQGVGFRPFVFRMAKKFGLNGEVFNALDGVHIIFNANEIVSEKFYRAIIKDAPAIAQITTAFIRKISHKAFNNFLIISSNDDGPGQVLLTPDLAMCDDCRSELKGNNRRDCYPFITCTNCGPRYSIIHRLPYDRENTSMRNFKMCEPCHAEYNKPSDRRYHSQTNSCPTCGISLQLNTTEKEWRETDDGDIIRNAVHLLKQGKIIAVKGIGGYLLIGDASNKECVLRLRRIKQRPLKPFALMYPDLEMLKEDMELSAPERESLQSPSSPIVILQLKEKTSYYICLSEIAPGLSQVGVMLPYAAVYELILKAFNNPVIATSANIDGSPIIYEEEKANEQLYKMADFIISNNRDIIVPQDDSVVKFSLFEDQKIIMRRSRGLAPTYINPHLPPTSENILATGAMLKSTFTLAHQHNIYISQYLGDLENYDVQQNYQHCLHHFNRLTNTSPEVILTDKHPDYFSTSLGLNLSKALNVPVKQIQHHEAHFAAVLGENNLIQIDKPVLGIIWDGIGLGNDGQLWGGEFFIYRNYQLERCGHLSYFDYILGDKMAREPRLSALSLTIQFKEAESLLRNKFSGIEWSYYQRVLDKKANLKTSSAGRLFDAVASLLNLSDVSSYEGEAAMYLERLALNHFRKNGLLMTETYFIDECNVPEISSGMLFTELISDIKKGKDKGFIAAKFHHSLAILIRKMAEKLHIPHIALSGGVFQNSLLVDLIQKQMTPDQILFLHRQLSPNDECISFGQLCCYIIEKQRFKNKSN